MSSGECQDIGVVIVKQHAMLNHVRDSSTHFQLGHRGMSYE